MIIAALDFGSAAICNTDYLEVYDAFLSGGGSGDGGGGGGGSTASRRLITRYCGNVSIIFSHPTTKTSQSFPVFESLNALSHHALLLTQNLRIKFVLFLPLKNQAQFIY